MKSKIAVLTVLYAHVLLIPWIDIFPDFLIRFGPFLLSVYIYFSINNGRLCSKYNIDTILGLLLLSLAVCTIITSISVNTIDVDSVTLHTAKDKYANNGIAFGITTAIKVLLSFVFVQYVKDKKAVGAFINSLYKVLLFYVVISGVDIILFGVRETGSGYIMGNKFTVSYLYMFFAIIYAVKNKMVLSGKSYYFPILIISLIVSIVVHCSTAVMGILLLLMFKLFRIMRKYIVYNVYAFIVLIACSILFAIFYPFILQIPFVQYIIVDVLGEDLTLTGRTYIYDAVMNVIELNPLWGMGIGNSYQLLSYLYSIPNAQNGFINLFLEQGAIGCSLTMIITLYLVNKQKREKQKGVTIPIICLTFTLIFLALVEITIDLRYVFLLTLLQITDKDVKESVI